MSKAIDTRLAVLKVLGGQSPGYAIFPNASAFVAEGLDPDEVARVLDELHAEGKVERELLVVYDEGAPDANGGGEPIPGGYRLRSDDDEGRDEVSDETTEPTEPTEPEPTEPTEPEPEPDGDEDE
jgi:hypothetical protein